MSQPNGDKSDEALEEVLVRTVDLDSLFDSLGARAAEPTAAEPTGAEVVSEFMSFGPADGVDDVLEALKSHIHADES